jgi:mannosyltransferase
MSQTNGRRQIALLLIVLLGFGIRLAVSASRDFWYDEAFSALVASQDWADTVETIRHDVHPPLYYVLLRAWVALSGNSAGTIRFFSIAFGTLTIPLAASFTARAWPARTWLPAAAGLIFAIDPFFVDYSVEARAYSLLASLMLVAGTSLLNGLTRSPHRIGRDWLLFSGGVALGFLTHYAASFAIAAFYAFLVLVARRPEADPSRHRLASYRHLILISLLPAAAFAGWLPTLLHQLGRDTGGLGWVLAPDLWSLPTSLYAFLFGVQSQASGLPPPRELVPGIPSQTGAVLLSAIVVVATMRLLMAGKRLWNPHLALCALSSFVPLLLVLLLGTLGARLYVERFLIVHGAFFVLFLILVLGNLSRKSLLPIVAVYVLLTLAVYGSYEANHRFRTLCDYLDRHPATERVIFSSAEDFVTGSYYLRGRPPELLFLDQGFRDPEDAYDNWYVNWAWISEADILTDLGSIDARDVFCGYGGHERRDLVVSARLVDGFVLFTGR